MAIDIKDIVMNREQRRKSARIEAKQRRAPGNYVDFAPGLGINGGDKITLRGVRLFPDGSITHKCKAGEETVFIGNVTHGY